MVVRPHIFVTMLSPLFDRTACVHSLPQSTRCQQQQPRSPFSFHPSNVAIPAKIQFHLKIGILRMTTGCQGRRAPATRRGGLPPQKVGLLPPSAFVTR